MGPTCCTTWPSAASDSRVAFHGSPAPRIHSVTRSAPGTVIVAVTVPPRRTVLRSTISRTGARASRQVRTGCQKAAARPELGEPARKSNSPVTAAPIPAATCRRVVRRKAPSTPGAANETTAAARVSAARSSAWLEPPPRPAVGLITPTMLPARPPASCSIRRPSTGPAASRRVRATAHVAPAALAAISSHASVTPGTAGDNINPSAAPASAAPRPPRITAKARTRACGLPRRCSRRAVSVIWSRLPRT